MKEVKVPVEVYSRVSGYYNPVSAFNKGKKEEFKERQKMKIPNDLIYRASTRKFIQKVEA